MHHKVKVKRLFAGDTQVSIRSIDCNKAYKQCKDIIVSYFNKSMIIKHADLKSYISKSNIIKSKYSGPNYSLINYYWTPTIEKELDPNTNDLDEFCLYLKS